MFTQDQLEQIINNVSYKDWKLELKKDPGGRLYIQVAFTALCTVTGTPADMTSRKWWISPHMCKSELIRTIYKAIEAAVIHELQENFKYKGRPIFNPHTDVEALAEICETLDVREPMK